MSGNDFLGAFYEKTQKPYGFSLLPGTPGAAIIRGIAHLELPPSNSPSYRAEPGAAARARE